MKVMAGRAVAGREEVLSTSHLMKTVSERELGVGDLRALRWGPAGFPPRPERCRSAPGNCETWGAEWECW